MKLRLKLLNETVGGLRIFQVLTRKSQYLRIFEVVLFTLTSSR